MVLEHCPSILSLKQIQVDGMKPVTIWFIEAVHVSEIRRYKACGDLVYLAGDLRVAMILLV